jgi:hypothetical protein
LGHAASSGRSARCVCVERGDHGGRE